ncbi:MAG: hypothetical protein H6Q83_2288 [Deltaproteobacteria bacterium]|nr:hypothetical protein [Deltaproteobacteria bacterium]
MRGREPRPREATGGFTLLELIIALAILAMIAGSVAAGIRLAVGSIERGEAVARDAARLRAAMGIVERALMSADPLPIPVGDNTSAFFVGEEKRVRFLSPGAPAAQGSGLRLISFFERTGDAFSYSAGPTKEGAWEWTPSWNLKETGRLPAAVRVEFSVPSPSGPRKTAFVVPVPVGGGFGG